jgi:cell shape-determining protein MreC
MDIDALVQNFRESQKESEEEEEEEENGTVLEEEKCRVKTYQNAVKSLKELLEFAIQWNDSDMLDVISQAKVFVESQAAKRLNCMQKTLLDYWKK